MAHQDPVLIEEIGRIIGSDHVAAGSDTARWSRDWAGTVAWRPLAVVRPANSAEVAAVVRLANRRRLPVVPVSGNTNLVKGTVAEGALMLSLDRMSAIREIRPEARVAIVEAGVIVAALHEAAARHDLIFPLSFGARGSAMVGGVLSTNAGGANVLRYGNTRDLCLGLEVVTPTGEVMNLMSALHKDNSGYDLRHLMIGAEGTLGIITAAVLKLFPRPRAYATAMVAVSSVGGALRLLNRLQDETGGAVEAFEYMPRSFVAILLKRFPDMRPPFENAHDINILVELGARAPRDVTPDPAGQVPVAAHLEEVLGGLYDEGLVLDAVVAQSEAQRAEIWARREASAQILRLRRPVIENDIAVATDCMEKLIARIEVVTQAIDPKIENTGVAHLGDGNLHYVGWPSRDDPALCRAVQQAIEREAIALGGSFSAEHGIGLSKLSAMATHKDPVALEVMRAIKAALDPNGIMNPGKMIPDQ
ncbi:FAD/FMN-containing dehydrogenase [Roseovarius azorensis]|uniref:FAD/FMN-containing dehydrogenase n=1 Tax=Roseovarius azorensis TaxID=1287727 RepID=A0A1H7NU23_9RHOB|nr:FAD-binding oxidoreductase [Roseovarius azorensis]SEL26906.1 FAD/FMN-containing dehydrogenase [Roseovarius azorensis]